jgi:cytochrome bd-type quinol oxidase subunit 2
MAIDVDGETAGGQPMAPTPGRKSTSWYTGWLVTLPRSCRLLCGLALLQLLLLCVCGALLLDAAASGTPRRDEAMVLLGVVLIIGSVWATALFWSGLLAEELCQLRCSAALSASLAALPALTATAPYSSLSTSRLACSVLVIANQIAIAAVARAVYEDFCWRSLKRFGANRSRAAAQRVMLMLSAACKVRTTSHSLKRAAHQPPPVHPNASHTLPCCLPYNPAEPHPTICPVAG